MPTADLSNAYSIEFSFGAPYVCGMKTIFISILAIGALARVACADDVIGGVAMMQPASGSQAKGVVMFTKTNDGANAIVDLEGLKPGKHGLHVHEKGDCSDPKAATAGAHFNPGHSHHGGIDTPERHAGDFGNIEAGANGKAHVELKLKGVKFDGPDSIIGKSLIVHDKEDDLKTDPSGNSGDRVACGVIEPRK
jgi:Cu-Zn family superoxide dismutase